MTPITKRIKPESEAPKHSQGGFAPDGSWDPHGDPTLARTRWVWDLCRERRRTDISPRALAMRIHGSQFRTLFGDLTQWLDLPAVEDWPQARTGTSAAQAVIHEGRGGSGCEWSNGHWVQASPRKPEVSGALYGGFRFRIIQGVLKNGWTPDYVAALLDSARDTFPEVDEAEIASYRAMGNRWSRAEGP